MSECEKCKYFKREYSPIYKCFIAGCNRKGDKCAFVALENNKEDKKNDNKRACC